jgi:hypothetical protein
MNKELFSRRQKGFFFLALLAAAGVVLLILPADYFDNGTAVCLSVVLLDKQCYGCGMTRAIQHLIHFEFAEAYAYNKLSFIVAPMLTGMLLWEVYQRYFRSHHDNDSKQA